MQRSRLSEIAHLLPKLFGWIPPQDLGEVVTLRHRHILTAGHMDMIVDHRSSQFTSWCWKVAGLPPLQLASSFSVDGNLVGVRVSFILPSATLTLSLLCKHSGRFYRLTNV